MIGSKINTNALEFFFQFKSSSRKIRIRKKIKTLAFKTNKQTNKPPLIALFVQIFTHNVIVEHTRDERAREILNAIIQH